MTKYANLFEQLNDDGSAAGQVNIALVANIIGIVYDSESGAGFRIALRDTPAIDENTFTMGKAARAYMLQRIKWLDSLNG